jgi:hypothetical protein
MVWTMKFKIFSYNTNFWKGHNIIMGPMESFLKRFNIKVGHVGQLFPKSLLENTV